jgi:hypothetical protein
MIHHGRIMRAATQLEHEQGVIKAFVLQKNRNAS